MLERPHEPNFGFNSCVSLAFEASEEMMESTFKSRMMSIDNSYDADKLLGEELSNLTEEAQFAWLQFRELHCALMSFEVEPNTSTHQHINTSTHQHIQL